MTDTKQCSKCGEHKPVTREFWYFNNKTCKPVNAICKVCAAAYAAKKYIENREAILEKTSAYQRQNKHKQKGYHERYKAKDPEGYKARRRANAARYRSTVKGALTNRVQTAVWHALRDRNARKTDRLSKLVGWTIDELKVHLEERFEEGMSWDNMSEWHIDHVMPISAFDVTSQDCEEFRSLWALKNLCPLWGPDNGSKHNDILWHPPSDYKNPKLRNMYPAPLDLVEFFNVDVRALKDMGYEAIAFGSATESEDSLAKGSFIRL